MQHLEYHIESPKELFELDFWSLLTSSEWKTLTVGQSILLLQSVFDIEHLAYKWWSVARVTQQSVTLLIESLFLQLFFNSFPPHTFSKIRNVVSKQQTYLLWKFKISYQMKHEMKLVNLSFLFFSTELWKTGFPFHPLQLKCNDTVSIWFQPCLK